MATPHHTTARRRFKTTRTLLPFGPRCTGGRSLEQGTSARSRRRPAGRRRCLRPRPCARAGAVRSRPSRSPASRSGAAGPRRPSDSIAWRSPRAPTGRSPRVPLARILVARAQPTLAAAIAEARQLLAAPRAPAHPAPRAPRRRRGRAPDGGAAPRRGQGAPAVGADAVGAARRRALALARAENRIGIALASADRADEAAFAFKRAVRPSTRRVGAAAEPTSAPSVAAGSIRPRAALEALSPRARHRPDARAGAVQPGDAPARARRPRRRGARLRRRPARRSAASVGPRRAGAGRGRTRRRERARWRCSREELRLGHPSAATLRNLAKLYARGGRLVEAAALIELARGNSAPPAASN